MRVIYKPARAGAHVAEIERNLKKIQNVIGGDIHSVKIAEDAAALCDEDSWLKQKPPQYILGKLFKGDVIICGLDEKGYTDIPAAWEDYFLRKWS